LQNRFEKTSDHKSDFSQWYISNTLIGTKFQQFQITFSGSVRMDLLTRLAATSPRGADLINLQFTNFLSRVFQAKFHSRISVKHICQNGSQKNIYFFLHLEFCFTPETCLKWINKIEPWNTIAFCQRTIILLKSGDISKYWIPNIVAKTFFSSSSFFNEQCGDMYIHRYAQLGPYLRLLGLYLCTYIHCFLHKSKYTSTQWYNRNIWNAALAELSCGIVSADGVKGHEIESRRGR
jgi:hypothetical protein